MQVKTLETRTFLALVVLVTAVFAWLLGGYLLPVFWAAVLAILFAAPFQWLRAKLGGRGTPASLLTLLLILLLVVAPLVGLGAAVTSEALQVYGAVASGAVDLTEPIAQAEELLPRVTRMAQDWGVDLDDLRERVSNTAVAASQAVASGVVNLGQQTAEFLLLLAVTLYLLFFFLRDGESLVEMLVRALPLGDVRERRLFSRFAAVTRATVKGSFIVAAVQGAIGGVTFALLGLGAPVLWGSIMAVCALIPAVGTALVWVPAVGYLLATGAWIKAIILIGVGVGVIGTVDNALRPVLVGRDAGMPDYMILLTTLAGLATFGISGLVIGPVIGGLFLTVWAIFTEEFGPHDDEAEVEADAVRLAVETPGANGGVPPPEALPADEPEGAPAEPPAARG
ncbi:MAG TPA: AI-2E family transporter [Bacteroidetes bacterium]|nr:AI-2E family transporter [Bacteroidota bacterium]